MHADDLVVEKEVSMSKTCTECYKLSFGSVITVHQLNHEQSILVIRARSAMWSQANRPFFYTLCISLCVCVFIFGTTSHFPVAVLWPRWSAVRLRQPCRLRTDGPAAAGLRVVLLRRVDLSEALPRETAFLCPFLHHIHTMVRPAQPPPPLLCLRCG